LQFRKRSRDHGICYLFDDLSAQSVLCLFAAIRKNWSHRANRALPTSAGRRGAQQGIRWQEVKKVKNAHNQARALAACDGDEDEAFRDRKYVMQRLYHYRVSIP
jgi:hypothetical protein